MLYFFLKKNGKIASFIIKCHESKVITTVKIIRAISNKSTISIWLHVLLRGLADF